VVLLDDPTSYVVPSSAAMKDTTISFKIERPLKGKLIALAQAENRTLSNFIEKILKAEVAKHERKGGRIKTE
jgi:predicted transcriptional regulator